MKWTVEYVTEAQEVKCINGIKAPVILSKQKHSQTVKFSSATKWDGFSQIREKKLRQESSQQEGPQLC